MQQQSQTSLYQLQATRTRNIIHDQGAVALSEELNIAI